MGEASDLQPLLMLGVLLVQRVAPQRPRCDDLLDLQGMSGFTHCQVLSVRPCAGRVLANEEV